MTTEIEAKFLNVDFDTVRQNLQLLGAVCEQPMRLMRRVAIKNNFMKSGKDAFLRIRDEGAKVTMTYKQYDDIESIHGTKEIEIEISDFEKAIEIFKEIGEPYETYQETKRETWRLGDVEVVLDEWPWLKPYIEIEGSSEEHVRKAAATLGFNWQDAKFGDVMVAYRAQYPHLGMKDAIATVPIVTFAEPVPEMLKR